MAKITEEKKQEHNHEWKNGFNQSEMKCSCGKLLISNQEFERRQAIWNKYYEDCKTTEAAFDFWEMRKAFMQRDLPTVKELNKRIESRCHKEINKFGDEVLVADNPLKKPSCPDPDSSIYIISSLV